jgi:hypothetical protein
MYTIDMLDDRKEIHKKNYILPTTLKTATYPSSMMLVYVKNLIVEKVTISTGTDVIVTLPCVARNSQHMLLWNMFLFLNIMFLSLLGQY